MNNQMCSTCKDNKGTNPHPDGSDREMVACKSKSHAKFMDTWGRDDYQNMLRQLGAMPLLSCDELHITCSSFKSKEQR
ncbi:hypothetical protein LCGC14_0316040 [marine sediment metagenome]|uniref:Uncharacterized protein n=1 Tax=marine sediment metagenome TaxID=412755 RepID=A0A0F9U303_9ZZZZ